MVTYFVKYLIAAIILALLIIWLRNEYVRDRFLGVGLSIIAIILFVYYAFFRVIYKIWVY